MQSQSAGFKYRYFELFTVFLRLGLVAFGGPVAHMALFRTEFVDRRNWLSASRFDQLLVLCQFLPGPASSQLGFAVGLQRAGLLGGILAFAGFTLPSALLMTGAALGLLHCDVVVLAELLAGLQLVAVVIVAAALVSMWKQLCATGLLQLQALQGLLLILFVGGVVGQVAALLIAVVVGWFASRSAVPTAGLPDTEYIAETALVKSYSRTANVVLLLSLCLIAVASVAQSDWGRLFSDFFYAGSLVFGGGHVVLPLLQTAVVEPGRVSDAAFVAGYGLVQVMPGPMFSFSAYLGALAIPQSPWLAAGVALTGLFLPGFLLLLIALPVWTRVMANGRLRGIVGSVAAAVVGFLAAALIDPLLLKSVVSATDAAIVLVWLLAGYYRRLPLWLCVLWCVGLRLLVGVL